MLGLEITQARQIRGSVRLRDTVANQVDQYAAFKDASGDDVLEQALYVFSKDRDFQDFLKSPEARQVASTLRVRKAPAPEALDASVTTPANGVRSASSGTGLKA
jgi:hypothetical protein